MYPHCGHYQVLIVFVPIDEEIDKACDLRSSNFHYLAICDELYCNTPLKHLLQNDGVALIRAAKADDTVCP